jgi:hypothetical protein
MALVKFGENSLFRAAIHEKEARPYTAPFSRRTVLTV